MSKPNSITDVRKRLAAEAASADSEADRLEANAGWGGGYGSNEAVGLRERAKALREALERMGDAC